MNIVLPCKNNTPTAKRTPHEAAFCADLRVEAHLLEDGQQLETFAATIQHCLQHEGILSKRVVFLDFSPSRRPDLEVVLTVVRNARLQPLAEPSTGAELGIQFSDEIDILGRVVQKGFGQSARHPNIGARFLVHLQNGRYHVCRYQLLGEAKVAKQEYSRSFPRLSTPNISTHFCIPDTRCMASNAPGSSLTGANPKWPFCSLSILSFSPSLLTSHLDTSSAI